MAGICNIISKNVATRKCLPSGGIKSRMWLGQVDDRTGAYTYKPNGALSSFVLSADANFITVKGRLKKGSGTTKYTKPEEGGGSGEQNVIFEVAYATQHELDAIVAILQAEGVFVLLETNAQTIRGYFWADGSSSNEAEEGTGTVKGDASGVLKITLKGTEDAFPIFFEAANSNVAVPQLQASIDYLDDLVTGAEVVD